MEYYNRYSERWLQCLQKDGNRKGKKKSRISNYSSENKFPPLLKQNKGESRIGLLQSMEFSRPEYKSG